MPSLKLYAPTQTDLPAKRSRRRVWTAPAVLSHAAVILTPARLYLVPGSKPVKPDSVQALESGADVEQLFGPMTVVVNLPTVVRAVLDLTTNAIRIDYTAGADRPGTTRVSIAFADGETADGVFGKLRRRLGNEWTIRPIRPAQWDRLKTPVATLTGILFATALLGVAAAIAQDSAVVSAGIFGHLDWRWVCGLGGVLAAFAQVWLYRRNTQPAAVLELVRG